MSSSSSPLITVVYYSLSNHIGQLAKRVAAGASANGARVRLVQLPETLSPEVLKMVKAPPKDDKIPTVRVEDLLESDGVLFGFPTRFGQAPAQFRSFLDGTGGLWAKGAFIGKPYSMFVSTGTQGGGQETTINSTLPTFVHHGMVYVPMGYSSPLLTDMKEIHGGSPWGAGTFAGADGSRVPSKLELDLAEHQGSYFSNFVKALKIGKETMAAKL